jgi:hypothetical protein
MNIETMKDIWQQQNANPRNAALNEQMLRRIVTGGTRSALEKITNVEYLITCATSLILVAFLLMIRRVGDTLPMVSSYIIVLAGCVASVAWGIFKITYLKRTDLMNAPLIETGKRVLHFRLLILKERLAGIISLFFITPAAYLLVFTWVRHENLSDHPRFGVMKMVIALALGICFTLIFYRRAYLDSLKDIEASLNEIKELEQP